MLPLSGGVAVEGLHYCITSSSMSLDIVQHMLEVEARK